MRPINLKSLVDAYKGLSEAQYVSLFTSWGVTLKASECSATESLVKRLDTLTPNDSRLTYHILDGCYFGFKISRISKEFDCLWIAEETVVNIELKSKTIEEENIRKQLEQNNYYLHSLGKSIVSFTFVATTGKCYSIDENGLLVTVDIKKLGHSLYKLHKEKLFDGDIETLFPPEKFLVSPFNSTDDFLDKKYFLTDQQQVIKGKILHFIDDNACGYFAAISGGPGSGKTLLMYDIARSLMESEKKVIIGHAGGLNNGQCIMNEKGWRINSTKELMTYNPNISGYVLNDLADVYFIDETQRTPHVDIIARDVTRMRKKCIFSFDTDQVMSNQEQKRGNDQKILSLVGDNCYKLTSNIRTNQAVYEFVGGLFDKRKSVNSNIRNNIRITFCHSEYDAIPILELLVKKGYKVPKFTPMVHSFEGYESWFPFAGQSAHQVIGQEFDCVAGLLSSNMYYDENGRLTSRKSYHYREDRMLYQILSRARRKIHLVIANNPVVFDRCMKLLNSN
ncbi:MAG: ATP-binding protein [Paludibacteraceae bacterium]|nr:ATP-binding protein [Paludibacteraceae bacterium]